MSTTQCEFCDDPTCDGKKNELREYLDWDDLAAHSDEEQLVAWVNQLAKQKSQQRDWGKRYRARQQAFTRVAKQMLDADELERLHVHLEERLQR